MSASELHAEGWYKDPYGAHEARWFSDGAPTALVRDGRIESHDPPPADSSPEAVDPVELPKKGSPGEGLLRADDAQAPEPHDERTPAEAAWETMPQGPLV